MKKIICLIVTVLLLINIMPFAALAANGDARDNTQDDTINFTISEVTVDPGNTTQAVVYVDIANNPGFAGAELTIEYGENLTLLSVAKCDEFSQQFNLTVNKASGFVMLDNVSDVEGNGSLLILTFSLNTSENKPTPEYNYDIDLSVKSLFDQDLDDIAYSVTPGKVVVKHDWTDATCTAPKTCKTCGATDGSESGHTEGEARKENVKPATDDKPGSYDKVVYCTVCGTEISRETITGVAKIGETCYGTLKEALGAAKTGETVTLVTDTTETILMVPAGVTLDLKGYTVEVGVAVLGYGHIVDTATVAGGIKIGTDKIVHLQSGNTYMPLAEKLNETEVCYRFFECNNNIITGSRIQNGVAQFSIAFDFANVEAYKILQNGNSKISIMMSLTWDSREADTTKSPIVGNFSEGLIKQYGETLANDPSSAKRITMSVSGINGLSGQNLKATFTVSSTTMVTKTVVVAELYIDPALLVK